MGYQVTAPLVIIPDETGAQRYFYKDAVLPSGGLDADRVKELAKEGMLEKVSTPEPAAPADPDGSKPDTVKGILAEVGDDREKAEKALEAEVAGENRPTLVKALEAVLAAD